MALIAQFIGFEPYSRVWLTILIESSLKAAAVLTLASLLVKALGRRSASIRHLVWSCAIACAVALPALLMVIPTWQISALSRIPISSQFASSPSASGLAAEGLGVSPRVSGSDSASRSLKSDGSNLYSDGQKPGKTELNEGTTADAASVRRAASGWPSAWLNAALIVWFCGVVVLLARLSSSFFGIRGICRSATEVTGVSLNDLLVDMATSMRIRRRVRLLISQFTDIPLTCGIFRPVIILPADVDEWPLERQRMVLCHELAHVKRFDALTSLIADLARVLYWFNPLVWIAAGAVRYERERACDDYVVASGIRPSGYASALLELSERLGEYPSKAIAMAEAIAMAHQPRLEGRLLAILDPRLSRAQITWSGGLLACFVAVSLILPLAAARPAEARNGTLKDDTGLHASAQNADQNRVSDYSLSSDGELVRASTTTSEMRRVIQASTPALPPFSNPDRESQNLSRSLQSVMEDEAARSVAPSDQILKNGKVARGYLGVVIQDVTPAIARAFKLDQARGALIGDVDEDGPASRAGLVKGDIITEFDGEKINGCLALWSKLSRMSPGSPVRLKIFRDGAEREVALNLGELPKDKRAGDGRESGAAPEDVKLGVWIGTLTPEIARQLNLPANTRGVFVTDTLDGSAADEAGLRSGDVILEVDRQPVNDVEEFKNAIKRAGAQPALLLVNRGGRTSFFVIGQR